MTIKEYFDNYNEHPFPKEPQKKSSHTIDDFYNDCICKAYLPNQNAWFENALKWHEMLMQYVKQDDAVLWIRYYESGKNHDETAHATRRACITKFSDGFSYAFVSNFDAMEIYNMVAHGVEPDLDMFTKMMRTFTYPLHYMNKPPKSGLPCEETNIAAYPVLGNIKQFGVLNRKNWYFAHIIGIKDRVYKQADGSLTIMKNVKSRIFPIGKPSDWLPDSTTGKKIRKLPYSLSNEDKQLVKAHFLRFADPLNYFLTPKINCQTHNIPDHLSKKGTPKQIGEYRKLTEYMIAKHYANPIIGGKVYTDYLEKIMADVPLGLLTVNHGSSVIDIDYSSTPFSSSKHTSTTPKKAIKASTKKTKTISTKLPAKSRTDREIILFPPDKDLFKKKLLKNKQIKYTYYYDDGKTYTGIWKSDKFSSASNLMNNICSRIGHRADKDHIIKAVFEV